VARANLEAKSPVAKRLAARKAVLKFLEEAKREIPVT